MVFYSETVAEWVRHNPVFAFILGIVLLILLIAFLVWLFKIQGHL